MKFGSSDGNLILSPNDTVIANSYYGTIKIDGEVNNPGLLEWNYDKTVKEYLKLAGDLNAYADSKQIIYITPYGEASKIRRNSKVNPIPGSTILVRRKTKTSA